MLIFDQLNKSDRHLRVLSWVVTTGLFVLFSGLWWVQVVRSRHYVQDQRNQSYRTVRVPAPRGKILDRNQLPLAENRATYNVSLYLEDRAWRESVQKHYKRTEAAARKTSVMARRPGPMEKFFSWFGYQPALTQSRKLTAAERAKLGRDARYAITSNIVAQLGVVLGQPLGIDEPRFHQHYEQRLALPMPIVSSLNLTQVARLQEQSVNLPGVDMEIQPTRVYPQGTLAAHVLGYLTKTDDSAEDELSFYNYRLIDYRGLSGIEASLDEKLRGRAGAKSVLVNNLGYRQTETILSPIEAGRNVTLTLDTEIQRVAEQALAVAPGASLPVRGAVVVLDVRTGEIIALASAPVFNPNDWIPHLPHSTWNTYTNEDIAPLQNRAVYGNYMPGSTFKIFVALAGLEAGTLDPNETIRVQPNPRDPARGIFYVGKHAFRDTAHPGDYEFKLAFIKSSNSYFIEQGLRVGPEKIVALAQQFHFGERTRLPLQESPGLLPTPEWVRQNRGKWSAAATGNLSIGQGDLDMTPLQLAVAVAAVANGGRVLAPQLVLDVRGATELVAANPNTVVQPVVREEVRLNRKTFDTVRQAMLADVEDAEGTGRAARVPGYQVCGKTGTAQVFQDDRLHHYTVWFASYAPFDDPHYAVVVMVDHGASGGGTCAPVAGKIYRALQSRDQRLPSTRKEILAGNWGPH